MKNVIAVLSLAWATLGCSAANAAIFEPPGTYVYNGSVTFARDVLILQCDMELTILVPDDSPDSHGSFPHGDSATAAAQFTGGDFGCTNNIIANTATVSASLAGGAGVYHVQWLDNCADFQL